MFFSDVYGAHPVKVKAKKATSVILFMDGGGGGGFCMISIPVWLPGPMFLLGDLCPWPHVPWGGGGGGLCPGRSL